MSSYVPNIKFTTEFEGDSVEITLKQLSRKAFIKLFPTLKSVSEESLEAKGMIIFEAGAEVLEEHLLSVEGLKDRNGNAVDKETILSSAYFLNLVAVCVNKLMSESNLGKSTGEDLSKK